MLGLAVLIIGLINANTHQSVASTLVPYLQYYSEQWKLRADTLIK
jgi:hypothetical protein